MRSADMSASIYTKDFLDLHEKQALQSARIVVPMVLNIVSPTSVIDIGCGRGAWLRAFHENGINRIKGLDGYYVDQSELLIDRSCFQAVDLSIPFEIEEKYDLAICLEVAEHLSSMNSRNLVRSLTDAAPLVLFSAAIPRQKGTGHINEQWPSYWKELFAEQSYERLDPIRRLILQDGRVDWWYRQNIFLYASQKAIAQSDTLRSEKELAACADIEFIHFSIVYSYSVPSLRDAIREVPKAAWRAVQRRFKK
jgi:hypothetical protein